MKIKRPKQWNPIFTTDKVMSWLTGIKEKPEPTGLMFGNKHEYNIKK